MTHFLITTLLATAPLGWFAAPQSAQGSVTAHVSPAVSPTVERQTITYQVVTNEIKSQQPDGSKVEVYRFDPSIYVVHQGDQVNLKIRGLKGHDHPVELEGYHLHDVVRRNQTTTLSFQAKKVGTYRLICTAHADAAHEGPMEAYLVVLPR